MTSQPPTYDSAKAARTGRVVGGSVIAVVGAVIALGGGGVLALGGTNGTFDSGHRDVSTKTTALVSEPAKINDTQSVTDVLGHPSVRISADSVRSDRNLFVGIGPKAQVDRYLAGAPIDRVRDFSIDPWSIDKSARPGTATPKPPAAQSFWVARSSGSSAATVSRATACTTRTAVRRAARRPPGSRPRAAAPGRASRGSAGTPRRPPPRTPSRPQPRPPSRGRALLG